MPLRDVITWNAMTAAYVHSEQNKEALQLFRQMQLESIASPDKITYATVLGACASFQALPDGKLIHSCINESGYQAQVPVANSLILMYSNCQSVQDARRFFDATQQPAPLLWNSMIETYIQHGMYGDAQELFDAMEEPDWGTWNIMIAACAQLGDHGEAFQLFRKMQLEGAEANRGTFLALLESCRASEADMVCRWIQEAGYGADRALGGASVKIYGRCGMLEEAKKVFDSMPFRDVVSWTTLIGAYAQNDDCEAALKAFEQMQLENITPDSPTLVTVLSGLTEPEWIEDGRRIHARIVQCGWETETMVENALITMYGKCGALEEAVQVFQKMAHPNLVSWNALIVAYASQGCYTGAFTTFRRMQMEGVEPNNVTFLAILNACMVDKQVKSLEACDIEGRVDSDVAIGNALLNMYGKHGSVEDARRLFDKMHSQRNLITWNAMISANVQNGEFKEAVRILEQMQLQGMAPNNVTFINILNLCSNPQLLSQGKVIHEMILQTGLDTTDVAVGNAVINMYGKCWGLEEAEKMFHKMSRRDLITWNGMIAAYSQLGKFQEAKKLFDEMNERDVVSWNSVIAAHSQHEQADEALCLFNRMLLEGMVPNCVTLLVTLGACANKVSLVEGRKVHSLVRETQLESDMLVGNSLVHMYGRCGNYDAAWEVFDSMKEKDVITWNGLIAAYAHNGHALDALRVFYVMQREGKKPTDLTFISIFTACSHAGRIEEARRHFASLVHDYEIVPIPNHYGCMVDLLARAGRLDEAEEFIQRMPRDETTAPWMALLSACRVQENVYLAKTAASYVLKWDPRHSSANVVLSSVYASSATEAQ